MKPYLLLALLLTKCCTINAQKPAAPTTKIYPGQVWKDAKNTPINAHGGGVLYHKGIYYWYGTHKIEGFRRKPLPMGVFIAMRQKICLTGQTWDWCCHLFTTTKIMI
jgi:hypothetical protein